MFGPFKKTPTFKAKIASTGDEFEVPGGITLLQAALNAGIEFPYDCRAGGCGMCRCVLKEGKIKPKSDFAYILNGEQLDAGMILACSAILKSDIVVEVDFDQGVMAERGSKQFRRG